MLSSAPCDRLEIYQKKILCYVLPSIPLPPSRSLEGTLSFSQFHSGCGPPEPPGHVQVNQKSLLRVGGEPESDLPFMSGRGVPFCQFLGDMLCAWWFPSCWRPARPKTTFRRKGFRKGKRIRRSSADAVLDDPGRSVFVGTVPTELSTLARPGWCSPPHGPRCKPWRLGQGARNEGPAGSRPPVPRRSGQVDVFLRCKSSFKQPR